MIDSSWLMSHASWPREGRAPSLSPNHPTLDDESIRQIEEILQVLMGTYDKCSIIDQGTAVALVPLFLVYRQAGALQLRISPIRFRILLILLFIEFH